MLARKRIDMERFQLSDFIQKRAGELESGKDWMIWKVRENEYTAYPIYRTVSGSDMPDVAAFYFDVSEGEFNADEKGKHGYEQYTGVSISTQYRPLSVSILSAGVNISCGY